MPHVPRGRLPRGVPTGPAGPPPAALRGAGGRLLGYPGRHRCPCPAPIGRPVRPADRPVRDASCAVGALVAVAMATTASGQSPSTPPPLRVVTLNILHGGPLSGWTGKDSHLEARLDLVAEALLALAPDVIALQEASRTSARGEVASRLAGRLGMNHVYSPSSMRLFDTAWINRMAAAFMDFSEGPAILSRFPIVRSETLRLPRCGRWLDPRVLLFAELATPAGRAPRVLDAHQRARLSRASRRSAGPRAPRRPPGHPDGRPERRRIVGGADSAGGRGRVRRRVPRRSSRRPRLHGLPARHRPRAAAAATGRLRAARARPSRGRDRRRQPRGGRCPRSPRGWRPLWPSDHYGVLADLSVFPDEPATPQGNARRPSRCRRPARRGPGSPGPSSSPGDRRRATRPPRG